MQILPNNDGRTLTQHELQDQYLTQRGWLRHQVRPDGNCLFRAISVGLGLGEDAYQDLRRLAIDHIRANVDFFEYAFLPDPQNGNYLTMDRQLDNLAQNGVFAGDECVIALSRVLQVNIQVVQGGSVQSPHIRIIDHSPQHGLPDINIVFSGFGGGHYDAIQNIGPAHTPIVSENTEVIAKDLPLTVPYTTAPSSVEPTYIAKNVTITHSITPITSVQVSADHSSLLAPISNTASPTDAAPRPRCSNCSMSFSSRHNLRRHYNLKHRDGSAAVISVSRFSACIVHSCGERFQTVRSMIQHVQKVHGATIAVSDLTFSDFSEFLSWKEKEECENNVFFRKTHGVKTKHDSSYVQYVCNRSGKARKTSKSDKRALNKKGTCKLGHVCPARMSIHVSPDKVDVTYIQTHTHAVDLSQMKYLPIAKSVQQDISTKLSMGVPINSILDSIRGEAGSLDRREDLTLKPFHLISRKTVQSVKSKHVNININKDSDDAMSVTLQVEALRQLTNNPVLLYKKQHTIEPSVQLLNSDFMLVLMSNEQAELYNSFAPRILCMDSTHGTNSYRFKLITILVIDDFSKGQPVAFCISNREDEHALYIFLSKVHERCPQTPVTILLTDDDASSISAAKRVFGHQLKHYLCIWHVLRSWDRQLNKIINRTNRPEMCGFLRSMLDARKESEYNSYLSAFRQKFGSTETEFVSYFDKYYAIRPEKWSLYSRKVDLQTRITTNNFLESFHKKLKYQYLERKENRRIDILLDVLLQIEKHCYLNRQRMMLYFKPSDICINKSDRHTSSLHLPDSHVTHINEHLFSVLPSDCRGSLYSVTRMLEKCNLESCFVKCNIFPCINLCQHLYTCSCPDTSPTCKHIHKIHCYFSTSWTDEEATDICNLSSTQLARPANDSDATRRAFENRMFVQNLQDLKLEFDNAPTDTLNNINKALLTLISDSRARRQLKDTPAPMVVRNTFSANKKIDKQPSFKPTSRKKHGQPNSFSGTLKPLSNAKKTKLLSDFQGSVAPYPPLRQVRPTTPQSQPQSSQSNMFVGNHGISLPSGFLVPPAARNVRIPVTGQNGKTFTIIIANPGDELPEEDS